MAYADPEQAREYQRQYREKNGERRRAGQRDWYLRNKEQRAEYGRKYRELNPDRKHNQALRRVFGIDKVEYDRLLAAQGFQCAICGGEDVGQHSSRNFSVDHCHSTGRVRGLLCNKCNLGLGQFRDDPKYLRGAAAYLERNT